MKEGTREQYEHTLHLSEASVQKKMIKLENELMGDGFSLKKFLQNLFECFKPKKVENFDSSASYQF